MSPYETAARWHVANVPGVEFREILEAHLFEGHVMSGPERFILGRQVSRDWPDEWLINPWKTDEQGDAWFVWLWAGEVRDWQTIVPWKLPWIGFHRGERLKWHKFPGKCFPAGK
jgi:hypothetical protein